MGGTISRVEPGATAYSERSRSGRARVLQPSEPGPRLTDSDAKNTFGDNTCWLAQVKAKYDPTNFFRRNNNIAPAG